MTPSVVVPGTSTSMTGTPPSCPAAVTTSAGTGGCGDHLLEQRPLVTRRVKRRRASRRLRL
jgi:hypothetical protein